MIYSLHIQNFVLIQDISLDFHSAFNVITGETGAGKSLLLDAILFVLGGKFDDSIIGNFDNIANVSIEFSSSLEVIELIRSFGIDMDDGENIIINRRQLAGQKRYRVNNQPATQKIIELLGKSLIDMHGQHSNTTLLSSATHMRALDKYAGLNSAVHNVGDKYRFWQSELRRLEGMQKNAKNIVRERDFLEFVVSELEAADVKIGEEERLEHDRREIQNTQKYLDNLNKILEMLESSNVSNAFVQSQKLLIRNNNHGKFDAIIKEIEAVEHHLGVAIEEVNACISDIALEMSLDEIEERLFLLRQLSRKYGVRADNLSSYLLESKEKLNLLHMSEHSLQDLERSCVELEKLYMLSAKELSCARRVAAKTLELSLMTELDKLEMSNCVFSVGISDAKSYSASGIDEVLFVASTNPGTPALPINEIASGGELSRFMLALQIVLHVALHGNALESVENVTTIGRRVIIFDEIDSGVGGRVANSIGERLKELSRYVQVLLITHQPQIAAKSDRHIFVRKTQYDSYTTSEVEILSTDARVYEIARMISGKSVTDNALVAAKELMSL